MPSWYRPHHADADQVNKAPALKDPANAPALVQPYPGRIARSGTSYVQDVMQPLAGDEMLTTPKVAEDVSTPARASSLIESYRYALIGLIFLYRTRRRIRFCLAIPTAAFLSGLIVGLTPLE